MKLFLASQFDQSAQKFVDLLDRKPQETTLLFIPTAGNPKKKTLEESGTWQCLQGLGFITKAFDVAGKSRKEVKENLDDQDVVFLNGGNAFYLLEKLVESEAAGLISEFVRKGNWYVGSSAGSVVAAPDIQYIAPMDSPDAAPNLESTHGLALTEKSVVPHQGDSPYGPIPPEIQAHYGDTYDLLELADSQALVRVGDKEYIA